MGKRPSKMEESVGTFFLEPFNNYYSLLTMCSFPVDDVIYLKNHLQHFRCIKSSSIYPQMDHLKSPIEIETLLRV